MTNLVNDHLWLVGYMAKRAQISGMRIEQNELVSLGMLGLLSASRAYDENKGVKFATFAGRIIRNCYLQELRMRRSAKRAALEGDRSLDAPCEGQPWLSLKENISDGGGDMSAYVAARIDISRALKHITPRARAMLLMHSMGYTQREIARSLGVTQATCSKTIARAKSRLRALTSCESDIG